MTGGLGQLDRRQPSDVASGLPPRALHVKASSRTVAIVLPRASRSSSRFSLLTSHFPSSRYATRAFTLIEMTVVIGIILVLLTLAVPTLSTLTEVPAQGAVRTSLRGLCTSARTRAVQKQQYVGIRFQQDVLGRTLAIMVEPPRPGSEDPYYNYVNGCPLDFDGVYPSDPNCDYLTLVAVTGIEPVVLAKNVELAEGDIGDMPTAALQNGALDPTVAGPQGTTNLIDATTFTVVYSPAGQIVRKRVYVGQRGYPTMEFDGSGNLVAIPPARLRADPVFNLTAFGQRVPSVLLPDIRVNPNTAVPANSPPVAMTEISQTSLYVYDRDRRIAAGANPFTAYVGREGLHIALNVYTGALIDAR